ncbi:MAG: Bax inhibitor-1/YccA family protein [Acidimicrobiales bacterium]|nr:Bax inhibitor-1/YccA family protein [Actinomycetota bacterium]
MASSNPALNDKIFERETAAANGGFTPAWGSPADEVPPGLFTGATGATDLGAATVTPGPVATGDTMRLGGTLSAAAVLLLVLLVGAFFGWQATEVVTATNVAGETVVVSSNLPAWIVVAAIAGFGLAILTIFKPKLARFTAPFYAAAQGAFVGAISKLYEVQFDGIVLQAVGLTIGVFVMMLVLYATGTVKVTDRLRKGIFAATGAVCLVYLATLVARLFGSDIPMIHDAGIVGIGFSLVVVGIASSNLLLDFDFIERGVEMRAPRYMEWFGAFGLMVTLIWLYLELLRLLSKLRSR